MHLKKLYNRLKNILFPRPTIRLEPNTAYDRICETYDEVSFNLLHLLDTDAMNRYLNILPNSISSCLDYGVGTGRNTPLLEKITTGTIYGCDLSNGMLERLRSKYPQVKICDLDNAGKIKLSNNSVNLITCNLVLGYIQDIDILFNEWDRLLRPEGFIIISDMHQNLNPSGESRNFIVNGVDIIVNSKAYSKEALLERFHARQWELLDYAELGLRKEHLNHLPKKGIYRAFKGKDVLFSCLLKNKGKS